MADVRTTRNNENVRIGPISIFTLITVLCIAILAVLAVTTAHASFVITERQATATDQLYRNETAAQTFLAELDTQLASARSGGQMRLADLKAALPQMCTAAQDATTGVQATAGMAERVITATFVCDGTRNLEVELTIGTDGNYRVEKWKMRAAENEAQPEGQLWTGM